MRKIAVVYWSGTGNTEAMAASVAEGVQDAGAEAVMMTASEFDVTMMDTFDAVAFGCPSMGAEELEESEFAPMFSACEAKLSGKRIALFGSTAGATVNGCGPGKKIAKITARTSSAEPVICNEAPDDEAIAACKALGTALAQ